ncbi:MAG TPA: ATP-binding protein [Candidatus Dormibacteraeota bacterium]|jgi:PAS domain S-box-containing protein
MDAERGGQDERYDAVMDALSDLGEGLVITEAGKLVYANEAYRALTGYTLEELMARSNLIELAPEELRPELSAGLADILSGRRDPSHFLESQLVTRDGRRVDVESSIHFLATESATRILAIVRDITKRKAIESEIRRLNDDLEQRVVERTTMLEAARSELDTFSYSVSHDLRAPLRAILGFSAILAESHHQELSSEGNRFVALIHENAGLMGRLVDSLLALSRLGRHEIRLQAVSPRPLAERAVDKTRAAHPNARVQVTVADLPAVRADADLLELVFLTLIDNAVKFSAGRPRARVRVGCDKKSEPATFFVRDNGIGFDPRYVDKIFGVFQRLVRPQDYDGVGSGLAIARRVVERHGGRLWAESAPGEGATFFFTLARPEAPPEG